VLAVREFLADEERVNSGSRLNVGTDPTAPGAHKAASHSSNRASAHRVKHE